MGNREERNEYATAKWDAEEVRRQASSEQRRHSDRRGCRRFSLFHVLTSLFFPILRFLEKKASVFRRLLFSLMRLFALAVPSPPHFADDQPDQQNNRQNNN